MNKELKKFNLKKLIKAPLLAAIDAEIKLHDRIQDFIINQGFEQSKEDTNHNVETEESNTGVTISKTIQLRMIEIRYEMNGKHMIMEVPALSLITLPLLTLKEATFDMDINLGYPSKKRDDNTYELYAKPTSGRINSSFPERKISGNLKVNLKLQEADTPSGLQELYGKINQLFTTKEDK